MTTTSSPAPASRRGLELVAVFFGATTVALCAGITAALLHTSAFTALGAGGVSFGVAFGIGMKVFEHLRDGS
ncbi:hypothetical protein [Streptomyces sp. NPDC058542]|uniref:hypothetical protein n=1 Tax=Streptomyces sp. NPDC058542 TaxID=3346543 RepID=UPI00364A9CF0